MIDYLTLLSRYVDMDFIRKHSFKLNELERSTSNNDFKASTDYVLQIMREAGLSDIERYALPMDGVTTYDDCTMPMAWDRTGRSTLEVVSTDWPDNERMLADTDDELLNAVIWSIPTPPGGVTAELVSLQSIQSDDWHEIKDKIVLCNNSPSGDLLRKLTLAGAAGLVAYVEAIADTEPDNVRWMNGMGLRGWYYLKDDPKVWLFSITPQRGLMLEQKLAAGEKITVKAVMATRVYPGETYTVTARVPGKSTQELALLAHMYEPFVADDAIGTVISIAILKALREMSQNGIIPPLQKSLRVIFSMERYGFSEYFHNQKRARKIIAAVNMDSACHVSLKLAGVLPELRHSPAGCPFFMTVLMRDFLRKFHPEMPFHETPGNLSDDTFGADSPFDIPTCWLHTPPAINRHHNSGEIFNAVDWDIAQTVTEVVGATYAALATVRPARGDRQLIRQVTKGVQADAVKDFQRLENDCRKGILNSYAANTIGEFLCDYHCRRITALNKIVPDAVSKREIRKVMSALQKKHAPTSLKLDIYYLSNSEIRLAYMTVTRDPQVRQIMSMSRMPSEERHGFIAMPSMLMNSLLDGKRNLYEAYVISNFMLKKRSDFKETAGLVTFYKRLAEYGYYQIKYADELTADDLKNALNALEVKNSDKLIVHSAYGSLGGVQGGPQTVVKTLIDHCGKKGVLMMPSFNFPYYMSRNNDEYFDIRETPSCVGVITDEFRKVPGVVRSLNPSHSIAVYGKKNFHWIKDHHKTLTMGQDSPLGKLEKADGYALMIHCSDSVTFMHVVEMTEGVHCLGLRSEEFQTKLPDGSVKPIRTWGWRGGSCQAYKTEAIFNYLRKHNLITEVMVRHSLWQYFKLSDYRKAYAKCVLRGKFGCMQCKVLPRQVKQTLPSDWDNEKQCVRKNSSAFTGDWEV